MTIPRKFNISTGVRRKALLAVPTICNKCRKPFVDKVYDTGRHKVICPYCNKVNAVTEYPTMESIMKFAEQYDSGTMGALGGISRYEDESTIIKKTLYKIFNEIGNDKRRNTE